MVEKMKAAPTPDSDYTDFFLDPEFAKHPGIKLPSAIFTAHQGKILSFESGKSITIAFPVSEFQTNPIGTLQGGILSSFFDETFGCLCFASLHKPCVTIDMTVNFIRPVKPGSFVVIHAVFKARGKKLFQLSAEAVNGNEKLVATATSNWLVYESYPSPA
ncbi:MAG: PaaI family thioesterase [Nitrospirae bacterium]|nr:PaaI family thioesterase [Nitrospirota bacterium]